MKNLILAATVAFFATVGACFGQTNGPFVYTPSIYVSGPICVTNINGHTFITNTLSFNLDENLSVDVLGSPIVTLVTNTVISFNGHPSYVDPHVQHLLYFTSSGPSPPGLNDVVIPEEPRTERYETTTVTRRTTVKLECDGETKEVVWEKVLSVTRRMFALQTVEKEAGKPVDVLKEKEASEKWLQSPEGSNSNLTWMLSHGMYHGL